MICCDPFLLPIYFLFQCVIVSSLRQSTEDAFQRPCTNPVYADPTLLGLDVKSARQVISTTLSVLVSGNLTSL